MHLSAAEGSESAAHLALLSGHARANGGAGQGIESVTDDQVTLRRHWQRPTKGAFHRDPRTVGSARAAPHRAFTPAEHNGYASQRHLDTGRGDGDGVFVSISDGSIFPQSFPQGTRTSVSCGSG